MSWFKKLFQSKKLLPIVTSHDENLRKDQMLKNEYGTYDRPEEVIALMQLEKELQEEGDSLDIIGFRPIVHDFAYSITPPDLIPFAHTGGNGVHFGFLTDFGQITNLREAPIVCVAPTNDPPIRYMARNITDFLDLAAAVPHVEMLEEYWPWKNGPSIETITNEFNIDGTDKWIQKRNEVTKRLRETFHAKTINVSDYIQKVIAERNDEITIPTFDGLGIIKVGSKPTGGRRFKFDDQRLQSMEELAEMRSFLEEAMPEEKLAFIRDAHYWYILSPDYNAEVMNIVVDLLHTLQLTNEANRLQYRIDMWSEQLNRI